MTASPAGQLTIVVSGMIGAVPGHGGATWSVLQYLLGFKQLGHRVVFVEALDADAVQPSGSPLAASFNAVYCAAVMREYGLNDCWALLLRGTEETAGLSYQNLEHLEREADVLVDISGTLATERVFSHVPIRIYLDVDPAFTQVWDAQGIDMRLDGHTHFVTVGQSIGSADCAVPTGGRRWIPTWQPVALDHWPVVEREDNGPFTTVANWRGYGSVEHNGVHYGQKVHSLRPFITVPTLTDERLLLALAIDEAEYDDLAALRENRWDLVNPTQVAGSPSSYREFIQRSKAEFGIAKSGYVVSRSGWFSDRSVCYLASGLPVLAQDTGFSQHLPTGSGLLAFHDMDDVLAGIEQIAGDGVRHAAAARDLAEEFFDARIVLTRLLRQVGA